MLKAAAIAGGALASTSLAASATAAAALTSERGRDDDQVRSLHRFLFSAGGSVHGGGEGCGELVADAVPGVGDCGGVGLGEDRPEYGGDHVLVGLGHQRQ